MLLGLGLAALLGLTLYISTLTYALRGYSRSQLGERLGSDAGPRWLDWLDRHEREVQIATGVTRVAANLAIMAAVALLWWHLSGQSETLNPLLAPVLLSLVLLSLFAVGLPSALAAQAGEAILARSVRVLPVLRAALWPLSQALLAVERVVRWMLGKPPESPQDETERIEQEILDAVTEGELHGAVDEEQTEMIRSIFELPDTTVTEIMTPRGDMVAVHVDSTHEQVREAIVRSGHSRLPVYEESLDQVLGVIYAKDLMRLKPGEALNVRRMMRRVPFVPESKIIGELLNEFRRDRVHIAIVLDEYGGTAGLVTIEDILEELVGEIDDEYDRRTTPLISRVAEDTLEVDARVPVHQVNAELNVALPEDGEYDTIGGFVYATLHAIPKAGEEFQHENVRFHVLDAEERKINRLRIQLVRQEQPA